MTASALVIDDDPVIRRLLGHALRQQGLEPVLVEDGSKAIELFRKESYDLVLLDFQLPDIDGLTMLRRLKAHDPVAGVVMLTGHGDVPTAVQAMKLGAEHFLSKPVDLAELEAIVNRTIEAVRLRRRNEYHASRTSDAYRLAGLGESPAMQPVVQAVDRLAATDATVLIRGETGVGKGWVAELIHSLSERARGPFVGINCAGLSPAMLDSELFGEGKPGTGRGTGALRPGLLDAAHRGTLFLDEIGDLAPEMQPRFLDLLDRGTFRRRGSSREVEADVRVIAATSRDLQEGLSRRTFRDDLFWRLTAHPIDLPPLRDRGPDAIVEMSHRLLAELRRKLGRGPTRFSQAALEQLLLHSWPGNVRELSNVLEHVVLYAGSADEVLPRHLPRHLSPRLADFGADEATPEEEWNLAAVLLTTERRHLRKALQAASENRSRTAQLLGISRATLYEKLKKHGLYD